MTSKQRKVLFNCDAFVAASVVVKLSNLYREFNDYTDKNAAINNINDKLNKVK